MNFHFSPKYYILCCAVLHRPSMLVAVTISCLENTCFMVMLQVLLLIIIIVKTAK